jgi:hypothetical protein
VFRHSVHEKASGCLVQFGWATPPCHPARTGSDPLRAGRPVGQTAWRPQSLLARDSTFPVPERFRGCYPENILFVK